MWFWCGRRGSTEPRRLRFPTDHALFLPPYAPDLNPMQRVWLWMKDHALSNRIFEDEEAIYAACQESWDRLTPERLQSVAAVGWLSDLGQLPARKPERRAGIN